MEFKISSPAFSNQQPIPEKYTCVGKNLSIPLEWNDPPRGTMSFALIMDDPDAPGGTWDHWILFNLPAERRSLPDGLSSSASSEAYGLGGRNSWNQIGYGGPCPPSGTHRYFIRLYALDTRLALEPGAKKSAVLKAMENHILAQAELMGTFTKR